VTRILMIIVVLLVPAYGLAQPQSSPLKPAEPDFTLVALPTALRLPKFGSAFRVTHRFTRPLTDDFGDVADDLFGIDSGAQIGLEYRFGLIHERSQVGIHRTSNRTIELFTQYAIFGQGAKMPIDLSAIATIEGTNNFRDSYSPALGVIVSRSIAEKAAFYVEPIWVNNSNPLPKALVDHNNTFLIGVGARVRVRRTVYLVGEVAPRPSGDKNGVTQGSFAIEKRVGGHMFQLTFSNAFGTTMGQIARGGPVENDWFLGFGISRKFF
jgi:Membrane bound beta barrel domain (DUF5777)